MPVTAPLEQMTRERFPMAVNEAHLAFLLLLDSSSSMGGDPIKSLNQALRRFKEELASDEQAMRTVDVAVVAFNSDVEVIQDFIPLANFEPPTLSADGCTAMGAGINTAIDMVEQRVALYNELGTPAHRPWVFMITDGCPTDSITSAKERIWAEESKGMHTHLKFFAVGTPGHDPETLKDLTRHAGKRYMALDSCNFGGLFHWMSQSMSVVSSTNPQVNPQLPALPEGATVLPPESW